MRRRDARRRPPLRAAPARGRPGARSSPRWPRAGSCRASWPARPACTARPRRSWTRRPRVPKVGVVGSLVWDLIHGRDPLAPPTEEWGGIAYALGGLDASLPPDWEIVPLIKVGRDLAPRGGRAAHGACRGSRRAGAASRCRRRTTAWCCTTSRRSGAASGCRGGVPGWTWLELGPMVRDLDAHLSQLHLRLRARAGHRAGAAPGIPRPDLRRPAQPVPGHAARRHPGAPAPGGPGGLVRLLRRGPAQRGRDAPALAGPAVAVSAQALGAGVSLLVVTLGPKGAAYVAAPGFDGWAGGRQTAGDRTVGGSTGRSQARPSAAGIGRLRRRPASSDSPDRPTAVRTALDPRASRRRPRPHRLRRRLRRGRLRAAARGRRVSRTRSRTPPRWPRATRGSAAPAA